jgi:hypothetical protein
VDYESVDRLAHLYKNSLSDSRFSRFTSGTTAPRIFWLCLIVSVNAMGKNPWSWAKPGNPCYTGWKKGDSCTQNNSSTPNPQYYYLNTPDNALNPDNYDRHFPLLPVIATTLPRGIRPICTDLPHHKISYIIHFTTTCLWRWNSVPKRRLLNTIRRRTTQMFTHDIYN